MAVNPDSRLSIGSSKSQRQSPNVTWQELWRDMEDGPLTEDPDAIAYTQGIVDVTNEAVRKYAPSASYCVRHLASLRMGGYLIERHGSNWVQSGDGESKNISFVGSQISALRHSGAMALLSPYKVRRAI